MSYVSSSCELYFGGTKVEELVIPDGVTSIPDYAFSNLTGITSVTIPDSVTSIGEYAFYNCSSLQSVTIGNGVKSIGGSAFEYCSSLTSATFKNTSGWSTWSSLSSVELADKSTAAQYLRSTYVGYTWTRS